MPTIEPAHTIAESRPTFELTVSDALVRGLIDCGCRRAFGILGGAAVPFFSALVRGGLQPTHTRHESGAAFLAIEHELAGGGPGLVFTTTGPGLTNTLTGVAAARSEGARLVVVSAGTGPGRRGRGAFQETDEQAQPNHGLFGHGGWFDYAIALQSAEELPVVLARLREGLNRPNGFTAHVCLPLSLQIAPADIGDRASTRAPTYVPGPSHAALTSSIERLATGPVCVWLGFGARRAAREVHRLVDALDARVMCSPRGKGIFPEHDARFIGVTGFGGHESVFDRLDELRPQTTLVLGTRLGELTSFWDRRLVGSRGLIHVDLDPTVFGAAYPEVETLGIQAEIQTYLEALLEQVPSRPLSRVLAPREDDDTEAGGSEQGVRPRALMKSLQRVVVERTQIPILAEAGNAFLWTTNVLRFDEPGRYRTSMGFGSMGHAAAGVVGTAIARGGTAIAVVGDGSMLMSNEVSTAVSLGVPAVWIVLNDGRYGLVADGMQGLGHAPVGLDFAPADFVGLARAVGAEGWRVDDERQLDHIVRRAIQAGGPCVIDVQVDVTQCAPFGARNQSLSQQARTG